MAYVTNNGAVVTTSDPVDTNDVVYVAGMAIRRSDGALYTTLGVTPAVTYTWAAKPAAASRVGPIFASDVAAGSYWVSDGTRYRPMNNSLVLYQPSTVFQSAANTSEQIAVAVPIPAGAWQDGDVITLEMMVTKSAGVENCQGLFRVGTAAAVLGSTTNDYEFQPSATSRRVVFVKSFKRISATTIGITNLDGNAVGLGADTGVYAAQTVPNMDSQTTYLQYTVQMNVGVETVRLEKFIARLTTPTV